MEDGDVLADYRRRVIEDTQFVKLAGIPPPRDRSGQSVHIQIPLDQVYIRIQATQEEKSRAQKEEECRRLEEEAHEERNILPRPKDALDVLRTLGEYFYRRDQVYQAASRPEPVDPEGALHEHHRMVVLGAPGSGKSTMLRYILNSGLCNNYFRVLV